MSSPALALVVGSAFVHAAWNTALRHVKGDVAVLYLGHVSGCFMMLLCAAVHAAYFQNFDAFHKLFLLGESSICCLASGLIHAIYLLLLAEGYYRCDLSVVYPVARGVGVALTAVFSQPLVGETLAMPAVLGVFAVVMGILLVGLNSVVLSIIGCEPKAQVAQQRLLEGEDVENEKYSPKSWERLCQLGWSVAIGLPISAYSIVDKRGVAALQVAPIAYIGFMGLWEVILLLPYVICSDSRMKQACNAMHTRKWYILIIGNGGSVCYLAILFAMQQLPVALVCTVREVAVVFGVCFGVLLLGETLNAAKGIGVFCILAGMFSIESWKD